MTVRRADVERENARLRARQSEFRAAADVVAAAWRSFPEVVTIALIGSVAKPLRKEVPRFQPFRRHGIELWHECGDLDLAVWLDSLDRLGDLRRARDLALRQACESGTGIRVASHQVDTFLFEPVSNRYLGRLCSFAQCPKGKRDCLPPGCGAIPFNKLVDGFQPDDTLLAGAVPLYDRASGATWRAADLPAVGDSPASA
ncbi:hypothetical protein [Magnetospirillum gryphiswaldense]|uniref:Uncharacterized protein n=1 Tax=Magnetospirillum gryphiswaldense TaxID=55518 RepID=A4U3R2_9PROT|nr:hypothetical protein [Magnetospirillum gryphiswaldense]AVM76173.1 hypothetical protein MSR1_37150 [Magnetospirillum gryphiswaldense MSR-1]AVM80076.1 hypothetical protein MSR1L_37150 [Magnetospirillum gryphiswaldense]CAM77519.1 conserved hypothetical protein [Magnetospirillum gryphiswaldense MSR-1]